MSENDDDLEGPYAEYDDEQGYDDGPLPPPAQKPEEPAPLPPGTIPALHDPKDDQFVIYQKDPRLNNQDAPKLILQKQPLYLADLQKKIADIKDEQDFFDVLRLYKRDQMKIIQNEEIEPLLNREKILFKLSQLAESILQVAYDRAKDFLVEKYGFPSFLNSYKQIDQSHLGIVSMGKLGSQEINYESDLDIIFIYSHIGETTGRKTITNSEFFSRLAQKMISILSIMTGAGRCYEIDTELRPSGNSGMLVISFDHFIDHQMNKSQNWEHLALVRARASVGDPRFLLSLQSQIDKLVYERPLANDFFSDMHGIRERILKEKVKESEHQIDIKLGPGSLMDIEFILQSMQLKNVKVFADLRVRNIFELLRVLSRYQFFSKDELESLSKAYILFRTVESLNQMQKKRSDSIIDLESQDFSEISKKLKYASAESLKQEIQLYRSEIRKIYQRIFH